MYHNKPTRMQPTHKNWNPGALCMTCRPLKGSGNFFQTTWLITVSSARGIVHWVNFRNFLRLINCLLLESKGAFHWNFWVYGASFQDGSLNSEDIATQHQYNTVCFITTTLSLIRLLKWPIACSIITTLSLMSPTTQVTSLRKVFK